MGDVQILVIDGVRYRKDDAERRGLLAPDPKVKAEETKREPKAKAVSNKAANPEHK